MTKAATKTTNETVKKPRAPKKAKIVKPVMSKILARSEYLFTGVSHGVIGRKKLIEK